MISGARWELGGSPGSIAIAIVNFTPPLFAYLKSQLAAARDFLATLAAGPAIAEDAALSALVTEALAANPDLRVAEQLTLAARQRPAQVSARPDPWLALGYTNQEIAKMLFISVRTAETHRAHIMQKLRLSSRAELVRYALAEGLLEEQ